MNSAASRVEAALNEFFVDKPRRLAHARLLAQAIYQPRFFRLRLRGDGASKKGRPAEKNRAYLDDDAGSRLPEPRNPGAALRALTSRPVGGPPSREFPSRVLPAAATPAASAAWDRSGISRPHALFTFTTPRATPSAYSRLRFSRGRCVIGLLDDRVSCCVRLTGEIGYDVRVLFCSSDCDLLFCLVIIGSEQ